MEKLDITETLQTDQKWSEIIPSWGCNIISCMKIVGLMIGKKLTPKSFYDKLLKHGVVSEKDESFYGYILDYYKMFEIYGIDDVHYSRQYKFTKDDLVQILLSGNPVKARVTTNKKLGKTHFMLIYGYFNPTGKLSFYVMDPMGRDQFLDSETWEFYSIIDEKIKKSGRKLDRIEWFV